MKEHPLLLSTEMVLAFLADRKQVTRRIPGPTNSLVNGKRVSAGAWNKLELDWSTAESFHQGGLDGYSHPAFSVQNKHNGSAIIEPIYQPGDLLWFRETFGYVPTGKGEKIGYKADHDGEMWNKWRPSIHLPKEACRLWAEVTAVSCERLDDITEEQAMTEGVEKMDESLMPWKHYHEPALSCMDAKTSFMTLWESVNGMQSWYENPPVYAINFKPLSKTGRPTITAADTDPDAWKRETEDLKWEDHH